MKNVGSSRVDCSLFRAVILIAVQSSDSALSSGGVGEGVPSPYNIGVDNPGGALLHDSCQQKSFDEIRREMRCGDGKLWDHPHQAG